MHRTAPEAGQFGHLHERIQLRATFEKVPPGSLFLLGHWPVVMLASMMRVFIGGEHSRTSCTLKPGRHDTGHSPGYPPRYSPFLRDVQALAASVASAGASVVPVGTRYCFRN